LIQRVVKSLLTIQTLCTTVLITAGFIAWYRVLVLNVLYLLPI